MTDAGLEVLAVGEVMALLDPDRNGPLEDVQNLTLRVAGAEGNVLIALSRLGHHTALVSAVGDDPLGRLVRRTLTEQGVDDQFVRTDPDAPTGVFFKERFPDGARRVYYYRTGSAASRLARKDVDPHELPVPQVLTVSGMTLGLGRPAGLGGLALDILRWASDRGVIVVFDANLRPGIWDGQEAASDFAALVPYVDVLVAGSDELEALVPGSDPDSIAFRLCSEGLSGVVVKGGAEGSVVHDHSGTTAIHAYPASVVIDPVGAGDAFAAGLISGILHSWSLTDAARLGSVLGAQAVARTGDWEGSESGISPAELLERYVMTQPRSGEAR